MPHSYIQFEHFQSPCETNYSCALVALNTLTNYEFVLRPDCIIPTSSYAFSKCFFNALSRASAETNLFVESGNNRESHVSVNVQAHTSKKPKNKDDH